MLFGLLAVVAMAAWWWWQAGVPIHVGKVQAPPLQVSVSEPARARMRDRYVVTAPLAGIASPAVRAGESVRAGQAVARISPFAAPVDALAGASGEEAVLSRAEDRLGLAERRLAVADGDRSRVRADAQRAEVLYAQRLLGRDRVEAGHARVMSADADLRAALAQRDAAAAEVDAARAVLALRGLQGPARRLVLAAPAEGVVQRVMVGVDAPTSAGQPLLEIAAPGAVEVLAEIRSSHALLLAPGTPVRLSGWGGPGTLEARVRRVEPGGASVPDENGMREQRVTVIADLDPVAAARAKLAEGRSLRAQFLIDTGAAALGVPTAALRRDGGRWVAFVVSRGRVRLRHLETGPIGEDSAAVYAGVEAGEEVVLAPPPGLRDGERVRIQR